MTPRSVGEWLARLPGLLTVTALHDLLLRALAAVESEPRLDFAYPTWRVYRRGEAGPEAEGTPAGER